MNDSIKNNKTTSLKVPQNRNLREKIKKACQQYLESIEIAPPLSFDELKRHALNISAAFAIPAAYLNYVIVMLNNELWAPTISGIPFERRILLLPQCLRDSLNCEGEIDEFGLVCNYCGRCPISSLITEAEELGYMVLVAEGTHIVMKLLEQGQLDAIIGVSCLSVLEKAFPHMAEHAIPGIAFPLIKDGCKDTQVDVDWVSEAIKLKSDKFWFTHQEIENIKTQLESWLSADYLKKYIPTRNTSVEQIAIEWLTKAGKRWRPLLTVCVYRALKNTAIFEIPEPVIKLAIATECFHKASLIHDDIEDDDDIRYGEETLHKKYGVPIALNTGDFLIGLGYQLISDSGIPQNQILKILKIVASSHTTLCQGQGMELNWIRNPTPITSAQILELFARKTSPAFNVALQIGAIIADCDELLLNALEKFSEYLGIAYQINDDIKDLHGHNNDILARRPSLLLALALEHSKGDLRKNIEDCILNKDDHRLTRLYELIKNTPAEAKANQFLEHYKNECIRCLDAIQNSTLKSLLRRLVNKIVSN